MGLRSEMLATSRPRRGAAALYLYMLLRKVRFNIIPFTASFVTETIFICIVEGFLPIGEQCRELWCETFLILSEVHITTIWTCWTVCYQFHLNATWIWLHLGSNGSVKQSGGPMQAINISLYRSTLFCSQIRCSHECTTRLFRLLEVTYLTSSYLLCYSWMFPKQICCRLEYICCCTMCAFHNLTPSGMPTYVGNVGQLKATEDPIEDETGNVRSTVAEFHFNLFSCRSDEMM